VTGRQNSPQHVGLDPFLDQQQSQVAQTSPAATSPANPQTPGLSPNSPFPSTAVAAVDPSQSGSSPLDRVQSRLSQDSGQPRTSATLVKSHSDTSGSAFVSSTWTPVNPQQDADPATVQRLRLRADTLVYRARLALQQSQLEEALQLAGAAERIENCGIPVYSASEERPFHLVRQIENKIAESSYAKIAAKAVAENPAPTSLGQTSPSQTVAIMPRQPVTAMAPSPVQLASRALGAVEANSAQRLPATTALASRDNVPPGASLAAAPPPGIATQPPAPPVVPHSAVPPVPGVPLPPVNSPPILASIPAVPPTPPVSTASITQYDSDPVGDTIVGHEDEAGTPKSLGSRFSWPAIIGLVLGLAGLCGLLAWRRLERRFYATTK